VGAGTALNIDRFDELLGYLWQTGRITPKVTPRLSRLEGGVSNRTVLVEPSDGPAFVVKQALERLRVETEWLSDPSRIEREALGLEWLARLAPPGAIPPLEFLDKPNHLLGMQAVPRPHVNWKVQLLAGRVERDYVDQFGRLLATIHRQSRDRAKTLADVFAERRFFETLRVEPYYRFAAANVPELKGFLEQLIADTALTRSALVHGDYSPKNILIHADKLVLLDHEVIHFGDPAFDLGFSLTHFLSKAHHLGDHRGDFLAAARRYWHTYTNAAGETPGTAGFQERVVRHTLGCLLARVAGRSPLEYLNAQERQRQRKIVLELVSQRPATVPSLFDAFGDALA
jgi:aminoglycoside phosphotransferase (APT) family kinase protein